MFSFWSYVEGLKQVVTSISPKEEMGLYWGYRVRYASGLSSVFKDSPYKVGKMPSLSLSEKFSREELLNSGHSSLWSHFFYVVGWI